MIPLRLPLTSLLLALRFLVPTAHAQTELPSDLDLPPSSQGKPVVVAVGFYVLDFARITARDESFDLTGYLELRWYDPRLVKERLSNLGVRPASEHSWRIDPKRVWTPRVFFHNAVEAPKYHMDPIVEVDANGRATSWAIVSGKFSAPLDLKPFPFDRQFLPLLLGAFEDQSVVRFSADPRLARVTSTAFLSDWSIGETRATVETFEYVPGTAPYDLFRFVVEVDRRSTFYVWRVLLPLTLLVAVSWAVFWFDPTGLQPMISTCTATLLSMVTFHFAVDFAMPKVAYLNLVDMHALIGFCVVSSAVAAVTYLHMLVCRGEVERAKRLQRRGRWLYPVVYLILATTNVLVALPAHGLSPHPAAEIQRTVGS